MLVVDENDMVEQRKVEIGPRIDSGLNPQDRVVVAGVLRAVPGQKVDRQMQPAAAASGAGGSRP